MALSTSGAILPLPPDVTVRIQSSAAITSLNQVVLGLVDNALDAHATKLEIDVDFYRGSCIVEDDGLGIPPCEFQPDGGFGKMHHTSKFDSPPDAVHGRSGTFLASLASLSVLTVTSHHCLHRQTSSITFHRSSPIATLTPAPLSHALKSPFHATRVTVRDLFGNMPVRVKQRAASIQDKTHHNRLWEELKRGLVSALLSWPVPVSLRVKDTNDGRTMLIQEPQLAGCESERTFLSSAGRRLSPERINSLLRQAGLIHGDVADSWIPTSASSKSISVKGVICLEPSPSTQVQFISLGVRPFFSGEGRNELLDHVNKLFSLSSFGAAREAVALDNADVGRRRNERRFTTDDPALEEPRAGPKGVDRWPMFYLEIRLNDTNDTSAYDKFSTKIDSTLPSITEVLDALVTSWLTANRFLIRRRGQKRTHGERFDTDDLSFGSVLTSARHNPSDTPEKRPSRPNSRNVVRKTARPSSTRSPRSPFSDFSRTKHSRRDVGSTTGKANLPTTPLPPDGYRDPDATRSGADGSAEAIPGPSSAAPADCGAIINQPEPRRSISASISRQCDPSFHESITLSRAKSASHNPATNRMNDILRDWENSVVPSSEQGIRRIGLHLLNSDDLLETAFLRTSIAHATKISKEGLQQAKVVAQVDKKFILVKIPQCDAHKGEQEEMLVLVDQHAMDERVKVEELFDQLCQINSEEQPFRSGLGLRSRINCSLLSPPLIFEVTAKEAEMLRECAPHFADWGILYDIESTPAVGESTNIAVVKVETLSPVIATRSRLEPKLVISLLRSEIWKLFETGMRNEFPLSDDQVDDADSECSWLKRIGCCPRGIVDMIHSRACRSAVMFNDALGRDECRELLRKVAECAFPFQCAHGRPTMVPLAGLGNITVDEQEMTGRRKGFFVDAYKKWRSA